MGTESQPACRSDPSITAHIPTPQGNQPLGLNGSTIPITARGWDGVNYCGYDTTEGSL